MLTPYLTSLALRLFANKKAPYNVDRNNSPKIEFDKISNDPCDKDRATQSFYNFINDGYYSAAASLAYKRSLLSLHNPEYWEDKWVEANDLFIEKLSQGDIRKLSREITSTSHHIESLMNVSRYNKIAHSSLFKLCDELKDKKEYSETLNTLRHSINNSIYRHETQGNLAHVELHGTEVNGNYRYTSDIELFKELINYTKEALDHIFTHIKDKELLTFFHQDLEEDIYRIIGISNELSQLASIELLNIEQPKKDRNPSVKFI